MAIIVETKLTCDACKRRFKTKTVKKEWRSRRRGGGTYSSFPDLLTVNTEQYIAAVSICKGANEWQIEPEKGESPSPVACSVKCIMKLAQREVEKLVKSKESSENDE